MNARRIFVRDLPPGGGSVVLDPDAARHVRVLRLEVGDELVLFDEDGREAHSIISACDPEKVVCEAKPLSEPTPPQSKVVLLLAIPKGAKLDECVRMATELGVHEIALMRTERTVPRWEPRRATSKLERLSRIASEAAAQSEAIGVPKLHAPAPVEEWLGRIDRNAFRVVFAARIDTALPELPLRPDRVWCAIGPEGGFTDGELAAFVERGFTLASLGRSVLRVDTAVSAGLSLLQDRLRKSSAVR